MNSGRDSSIQKKVHYLETEIKNMKMSQAIGGDAWVVYRLSGVFSADTNNKYIVDFTPDNEGEFTAQLWEKNFSTGLLSSFYPDPTINGRWYFIRDIPNPVTISYMMYSTKTGSINVTEILGNDPTG